MNAIERIRDGLGGFTVFDNAQLVLQVAWALSFCGFGRVQEGKLECKGRIVLKQLADEIVRRHELLQVSQEFLVPMAWNLACGGVECDKLTFAAFETIRAWRPCDGDLSNAHDSQNSDRAIRMVQLYRVYLNYALQNSRRESVSNIDHAANMRPLRQEGWLSQFAESNPQAVLSPLQVETLRKMQRISVTSPGMNMPLSVAHVRVVSVLHAMQEVVSTEHCVHESLIVDVFLPQRNLVIEVGE